MYIEHILINSKNLNIIYYNDREQKIMAEKYNTSNIGTVSKNVYSSGLATL